METKYFELIWCDGTKECNIDTEIYNKEEGSMQIDILTQDQVWSTIFDGLYYGMGDCMFGSLVDTQNKVCAFVERAEVWQEYRDGDFLIRRLK